MSVLFFLRTAGAALLAAWVMESVFRKDWKSAGLRMGAALIPIFLWFGYTASVKASDEYQNPAYSYQRAGYIYYNTDYFTFIRLKGPHRLDSRMETPSETFVRFLTNVQKMPAKVFSTMAVDYSNLSHVFLRNPLPSFFPERTYYYIPFWLGVISFAGIYFFIAKKQWMVVFFLLFFLPPVFLWPFTDEMYRILIPVAPIFAVAFFRILLGLRNLLAKYFREGRWNHVPGFAILFALFILQGVVFYHLYRFDHNEVFYRKGSGEIVKFRWFYYNPSQKSLDQALEWLDKTDKRETILIAMDPQRAYLRTGMKSVVPPFVSDTSKAKQLLESIPAGYLLLDVSHPKLTVEFTAPVVHNHPEDWMQVYAAPESIQQSIRQYQKQAYWRQDDVDLPLPSIHRHNSPATQ
jgi:hypothetical protein